MTNLVCGCCGVRFRGDQDPEHDRGFGTCAPCRDQQHDHNETEWDRLRDLVARSFRKETNRARFMAMEPAIQRGVILRMMESGVITWTIGEGQ